MFENQSIPEFYAGRSVLLTGATGFLGKAVIDRLLRSCPDIEKIYLLVRPKRGVDVQKRVEDILSSELFDTLRQQQANFASKVVAVTGDIAEPNLGMLQEEIEILRRNVSVVIHSAATVNFNEQLKNSYEMNVLGATQMIRLAKTFDKLASYVHVSTAYSQCDRDDIAEGFYEPVVKPEKLYDMLCTVKDVSVIDKMTPALLQQRPNTYTFTKSLAEIVVKSEGENMPISIMRPSIIAGVFEKGKTEGWTDNLNGAAGLYLSVGYGFARVMPGCGNCNVDLVPVDFCAALLVAMGWKTAKLGPVSEPRVYNCVSGTVNPIKWEDHNNMVLDAIRKHMFTGRPLIRRPTFKFVDKTYYPYRKFVEMTLPVYLGDAILYITMQKPRLRRLFKRVESAIEAYAFFTSRGYSWSTDNVQNLIKEMSPEDRKNFNFDFTQINWPQFLEVCWLGLRKFARRPTAAVGSNMATGSSSSSTPASSSSSSSSSSAIRRPLSENAQERLNLSQSTVNLLLQKAGPNAHWRFYVILSALVLFTAYVVMILFG